MMSGPAYARLQAQSARTEHRPRKLLRRDVRKTFLYQLSL